MILKSFLNPSVTETAVTEIYNYRIYSSIFIFITAHPPYIQHVCLMMNVCLTEYNDHAKDVKFKTF